MTARIGIVGAAGRMGQMLVREVGAPRGAALSGGTEAPGSGAIGRDPGELAGAGPTNTRIGTDAAALFAASDVVIDFTVPAASVAHARLAAEAGKGLVIGPPGFGPEDERAIAAAAA
ncbi:MAG: 4-hydroxy-tetrahydrodipicolinate reductase, partial [Alphaproteobacteria bacterium]